jgi:hypothetical protein
MKLEHPRGPRAGACLDLLHRRRSAKNLRDRNLAISFVPELFGRCGERGHDGVVSRRFEEDIRRGM